MEEISGSIRAGRKTEAYMLHIRDKSGNTEALPVSYSVWNHYKKGDELVLKKNGSGGATIIEIE